MIYGQNDDEIEKVLEEIHKLEDIYPPSEGIKIVCAYKSAMKNHPKNTLLLSEALAFFTMFLVEYDVLNNTEKEDLIKECVRIADLIIKYSDSEETVTNAKTHLIGIYCKFGSFYDAIRIANGLPASTSQTRDISMSIIMQKFGKTEDEINLHISNIEELMSALLLQVTMLANCYKKEERYEDALFCYNFANKILESLYGENKYRPPYIQRGMSQFGFPADCLIKLGREEEALDVLERFTEFYIAERNEYNKTKSIDNPIMHGRIFSFGYEGNAEFEEYYQNVIGMSCFEQLRNHPRFIKVTEKLSNGKNIDANITVT